MKTIRQTYRIKAPIEKVWKALIDPKKIEEWGGGPVIMRATEMSEFSLWGGDVYGKNLKVVKEKELTQEWISKDLRKPTRVAFKLKTEDGAETKLELVHENLPDNRVTDFSDGWRDFYLGPLKKLVEKSK